MKDQQLHACATHVYCIYICVHYGLKYIYKGDALQIKYVYIPVHAVQGCVHTTNSLLLYYYDDPIVASPCSII